MFIDTKMISGRHWAVDVETTALLPSKGMVTSIGIAEFNPFNVGTVPKMVLRCAINHANGSSRYDPATMEFRKKEGIGEIETEMESMKPGEVFAFLNRYVVGQTSDDLYVWAWHSNFDFAHIAQLVDDYVLDDYVPWSYRNIIDAPSVIRALGKDARRFKREVSDSGKFAPLHDPFQDALILIECVHLAVHGS